MKKRIGIIGLGWLGQPLAKRLAANGHLIKGTVTTLEKCEDWNANNPAIKAYKVIAEKNQIQGDWAEFVTELDLLILNIPPKRQKGVEQNYPAKIEQLLKAVPSGCSVIFISSTSVYGNHAEFVDEQTPCKPEKNSGKAVLQAEQWIKSTFKEKMAIIRFAGLYGPKRNPARFLKGERTFPNPAAHINFIHQKDCINLIEAVIKNDAYGEIYNGCADAHPQREAFYTLAADYTGNPIPQFDYSKKSEGKIVENKKSKTLLGSDYNYHNPLDLYRD